MVTHRDEARMEALRPPKQESATARGMVQFITPNTWSANVWQGGERGRGLMHAGLSDASYGRGLRRQAKTIVQVHHTATRWRPRPRVLQAIDPSCETLPKRLDMDVEPRR